MRLIAVEEKDIQALMDKLELAKFKHHVSCPEDRDIIRDMHRRFHSEVVQFFHQHGSNYPNG